MNEKTIGYLGPVGTYCEMAALSLFGKQSFLPIPISPLLFKMWQRKYIHRYTAHGKPVGRNGNTGSGRFKRAP